ncbi:MAG: 3-phosphoshikimate 1-carboxyvinyltransferase [Pseudomonadota bacterium]
MTTPDISDLHGPRRARPASGLRGRLNTSPDKSISHRALILSALAEGRSRLDNLLDSADVLATAGAVQKLGAYVERAGPGSWIVNSGGAWSSPDSPLDLGNSGTGVRLLMGAAARFDLTARFVGDQSLSSRPMERILTPLRQMGVQADAQPGGRLPVMLTGRAPLSAITYQPPMASAQVKSAVLLAGLGADGETCVIEPRATRGHTETMAPLFGAELSVERDGTGLIARIKGPARLHGADISAPGDPSSAAFAVIAALICPDSEVTLTGVMTNPARFGLYQTLQEMGADLTFSPAGERCGEPLVDITARSSTLKNVEVPAERAPSMIDEYPILCVAAAFADGETRMRGLEELRAKESDRLAASAALLEAAGVGVELAPDGLVVHGRGPGGVEGGGLVATRHDHRLAMSGLILGLGARDGMAVDDVSMIATSYPAFLDDLAALGAVIGPV